ncbi:MAG: NUDIX domain-containing protein [Chloroflexaceae bacterium]|nr:NUDIX domain-containing protein [Chloroflexaceae bacterium]
MSDRKSYIRTAAKACIVRDGLLLVQHMRDAEGDFYTLPGGGQERGETLPQTAVRECYEEIGVTVHVGALRFVHEHIRKTADDDIHQIDMIFLCTLAAGAEPHNGSAPDKSQIGVTWLPLAELADYPFFPEVLRPILPRYIDASLPFYYQTLQWV